MKNTTNFPDSHSTWTKSRWTIGQTSSIPIGRQVMRVFVLIFCCISALFAAPLDKHLKKIEGKNQPSQIRNIDFIYMINLDQRPERLKKMIEEFAPYAIQFHRFPAIYGWSLPQSVMEEIGLIFKPWMKTMINYPVLYNGYAAVEPDKRPFLQLGPNLYEKSCFSVSMKPGGIGCALSHLSILQDALDSGYKTIWVLEDDVKIINNPHELSEDIDLLDKFVGESGWDILYTDDKNFYKEHGDVEWIWRPDLQIDNRNLIYSIDFGTFHKIGGRGHTHSMIIRRSGIEKILAFEKTYGLFLPYDMELSVIPGLCLYNLKQNKVVQNFAPSDTNEKNFE
jgi:GR25 family glycosyltransferase involved in LPS biosynthesis